MILTPDQIKGLHKTPKNNSHIQRARRDNIWQSFHAKPSTDKTEALHYKFYIEKVQGVIRNKKKRELFEKIISFPLPSTKVISEGTDDWNKIYTAQDRTIEYYFEDKRLVEDYASYLDDIGINHIVEQNIFTCIKQSINTIAVVDLPNEIVEVVNEGMLENPESSISLEHYKYVSPYVTLVDAANIHDIDENYKGDIEYVMFYAGVDNLKLVVIDAKSYYVYDVEDGEIDEERPPIISDHNLGYCPATMIWSDKMSPDIPFRRFNAVTECLSDMDQLVMSDVFSKHMDLYAGFVQMWRLMPRCTFEDENQNPCKGGFVRFQNEDGTHGLRECPSCSKSDLSGPGTVATMPVSLDKETNILKEPMGFINPDVQILDYNLKKVEKLKADIKNSLTGGTLKVTDDEAVNEDQVRSQYEGKQSVLMYLAENVQKVHKFLVDTIARLRYGSVYQGSTINYGYDFFLIDMNTAVKEFDEAMKSGLPSTIVAEKREVVMGLHSRQSPEKRERLQMLQMLEPYVDIPIEKVPVGTIEFEIKANFSNYIARFESEFVPITLYWRNKSLHERINSIYNHIKNYVEENKKIGQEFLRKFGQGEEVSGDEGNAKLRNSSSVKGG